MELHKPVLLKEVLEILKVTKGKKFIDATLGEGGHTEEILRQGGDVLGVEWDPVMMKRASRRLSKFENRIRLVKSNFKNVDKVAPLYGFRDVDGILFDLGTTLGQLKDKKRGFSFNSEARLDMRMDPSLKLNAHDLVNGLNEKELFKLFEKYGEEKYAWRIAHDIVRRRRIKPIWSCRELAELVSWVKPRKERRIHPATKVFLALRIAVNDEINNLRATLPKAFDLLQKKGRLVIISFHSLEDRIVKKQFVKWANEDMVRLLTKKPIRPRPEEIKENLSARSAKLRAVERLTGGSVS